MKLAQLGRWGWQPLHSFPKIPPRTCVGVKPVGRPHTGLLSRMDGLALAEVRDQAPRQREAAEWP